MLDVHNQYVKIYRMARDMIHESEDAKVQIKLVGKRNYDGRQYNLPTSSEVAVLIVGDIDSSIEKRDIVVQYKGGPLHQINELHASYLPLQYPLLFPYGEDGYRTEIGHKDRSNEKSMSSNPRNTLTMREWFAFRIMDRDDEPNIIIRSGKLFQQFIVNGWTMIESERLSYIRRNQTILRAENYMNLKDAATRGNADSRPSGHRVVLPSTFHGGDRFMSELYHDAMGICKTYGYPDLFITFTCNSNWPELKRFAKKTGLRVEDRPDIICRVFKIKLDELVRDLTKGAQFGKTNAWKSYS